MKNSRNLLLSVVSFMVLGCVIGTKQTSTEQVTNQLTECSSLSSNAKLLCDKAYKGDANAQYLFGGMYYIGQGMPKSNSKAFKWCKKSAEQGFSKAQLQLANMYRDGEGVAKSHKAFIKWTKKAAEQGNSDALFNLGVANMKGELGKPSVGTAIDLFRKSAELGNERAKQVLKKLRPN